MALRNLNFTLQGDRYVAEETVNADYALHLERKAAAGFIFCSAVRTMACSCRARSRRACTIPASS